MNPVIVTAAIIKDKDKILITQRKRGKNQELKWEFPGGKLEEGETPEECLKREIQEELDITIDVCDIYKVVYHRYATITILLLAYECTLKSGTVSAVDCSDFKWVDLSEMKDFDFAEADLPIIEKMLKRPHLALS